VGAAYRERRRADAAGEDHGPRRSLRRRRLSTAIAWLDKRPDFWKESRDLSEWKLMVNDATDMLQVVQLFS
jgi:hypothetical protein